MIDPDLFESLDSATRISVKHAIMTLTRSGILMSQKERLFRRVAQGADNETPEIVTQMILDYRKNAHGLEAFHQLGEQFIEENES